MNKYADEFYATFQELARKYSAEKVWQDVIYACCEPASKMSLFP